MFELSVQIEYMLINIPKTCGKRHQMYLPSNVLIYRGGQRFAGDSDFHQFLCVPHLKLISMLILKEPYSIEKCATCLDTFLRF